jgi:antibiotic biosynthesis monooxygenase (ABM) superfamily enzyme
MLVGRRFWTQRYAFTVPKNAIRVAGWTEDSSPAIPGDGILKPGPQKVYRLRWRRSRSLENDLMIQTAKDVTIAISRTVFPGRIDEYEEWIRKMLLAASKAPGYMGVTTLIPQEGKTGLYHVLFRFEDQATADASENSEIRKNLTGEADEFSRYHRRAATGLETWFTIPECPQVDVPLRGKQVLVTTLGVYITSTVIIKIFGRFNLGLNY